MLTLEYLFTLVEADTEQKDLALALMNKLEDETKRRLEDVDEQEQQEAATIVKEDDASVKIPNYDSP